MRVLWLTIPLVSVHHRGIFPRLETEHGAARSLWHSVWWWGLAITWV